MSGKKGQTSNLSTAVPEQYMPDFLSSLDGRCRTAKILRSRLSALHSDLGGRDALSYIEQSLSQRLIYLEARIQTFENTLATGNTVDDSAYMASINAFSGLCNRLGIKRRARPIASLHDYTSARLKGSGAVLA